MYLAIETSMNRSINPVKTMALFAILEPYLGRKDMSCY